MEILAHRLADILQNARIAISTLRVILTLNHQGQLYERVITAITRAVKARDDFQDVGPAQTFPHRTQALHLYGIIQAEKIPGIPGDKRQQHQQACSGYRAESFHDTNI